jgi:inner membrane protein
VVEEGLMEPLTQGLLGASCGQALYGRELGRRAVVLGALVGMAPDLDVVMNATGPMGEWLWHRGATHALWFGPVVGPAVGWGLHKWKGGRLAAWVGLAVVALFTHPLLDLFTSYGTQLLAPFSRRRFALDAVAIIDPAYSVLLAVALCFGLWRGIATRAARVAALLALLLSTAYLFLGLQVNRRAETIALADLEGRGFEGARVHAYPTLLQLPLRRLVARRESEVGIGWVSLLTREPIEWEWFADARHPLVDAARRSPEGQIFEWFAMGQTAATMAGASEGAVVEIDDLRYGLPGRPAQGLWGIRVRFGADGRPASPVERVDRPLPAPATSLLTHLLRRTVGVASP